MLAEVVVGPARAGVGGLTRLCVPSGHNRLDVDGNSGHRAPAPAAAAPSTAPSTSASSTAAARSPDHKAAPGAEAAARAPPQVAVACRWRSVVVLVVSFVGPPTPRTSPPTLHNIQPTASMHTIMQQQHTTYNTNHQWTPSSNHTHQDSPTHIYCQRASTTMCKHTQQPPTVNITQHESSTTATNKPTTTTGQH